MAAPNAKDKLLDASLSLIREQGFAATTVDDLCARAGVTKGAFFHHFESKDALGVAAVEHWSRTMGAAFRAASYHDAPGGLGRVRAYLALRKSLIRGGLAEFTCVAGTLVQETYGSHPAIRAACADSIFGHAGTLVEDFAAAIAERGIEGDFTAESLAAHTQCVLQGAFILAKARGDARIAVESIEHLERYVALLFNDGPEPPRARPKLRHRNRPEPRHPAGGKAHEPGRSLRDPL
jgi:TetR/AcrR family transcriptional regulator, transcriptional repressor for nem operon